MPEAPKFGAELSSLKIDRSQREPENKGWAKWWIILGVLLFVGLGVWRFAFSGGAAPEVSVVRVSAASADSLANEIALDAAGYIVAHHKIEVASKVVGRVASISVEKGDKVERGQALVRLEDDEFRARVRQAEGNLAALRARLAEFEAGSRPEEIERARANLEEARADSERLKLDVDRVQKLTEAGVVAVQEFDRAREQYNAQAARVEALQRAYELAQLGPRKEATDAVRGQVQEAAGQLDFARTQLDGTIIRAPVTGTILERNVEIGEFVTTSFVGERGAKGYVVSLADLNDLQVELDISQNDFAKLAMGQKAVVRADAYRDKPYDGEIVEISPEADRQKATVQVKVQILNPDELLRPEMNANVSFTTSQQAVASQRTKPVIRIPASAVRDGQVFLYVNDKAVARAVEIGERRADQVEILSGLSGGEDVIVAPPAELTDGAAVRLRVS
jgi:HlyD family secretion protein